MTNRPITVRLMSAGDFDAVVGIDLRTSGSSRLSYYRMKFDKLFESKEFLPTSLVAVDGGDVVGFVMAELYVGEYGISQAGATLDTIGVEPAYRKRGIGKQLIDALMVHLKELGVEKVNTLVNITDLNLIGFFDANQFARAEDVVNLERVL